MNFSNKYSGCLISNDSLRPSIELRAITKEQNFEDHSQYCKIVISLNGEASFSFGKTIDHPFQKGKAIFVPPDYSFSFNTNDKANLLIFRLSSIQFCECYSIENLLNFTSTEQVDERENCENPFLLNVNNRLEDFLELLLSYKECLCCKYYSEIKIKELIYLLRIIYPKEALAMFFRDAISYDSSFSHYIIHNYHKYSNRADLAAAMHMTLSSFEKRFKLVFGESPHRWINKQRTNKIYHALSVEKTPLKELATRFGFANKSSFSSFCSRNFKLSPGKIRKNMQTRNNKKQNCANE